MMRGNKDPRLLVVVAGLLALHCLDFDSTERRTSGTTPFIGEIRMFGGKDAPRGWALCNGQLLSVAEHPVLFSVIGNAFGGDGLETFALPNLQGRVPMHWGAGAGLSPRTLGESGGNEFVTITQAQLPSHSHPAAASDLDSNIDAPGGAVWAKAIDGSGSRVSAYGTVANTTMSPSAIGATGGNQPLGITNPFQCVTFIIALEGIPPTSN